MISKRSYSTPAAPPWFRAAPLALLVAAGALAAPTGLVHHWNFDEGPDWHDDPFQAGCTATVARDSAGTADAALQNMGGANWVSGRQFTGLAFDGTNDFLLVNTNLAATLGGTASLSFWLRTSQAGGVSSAAAPAVTGVAGGGGAQWGWLDEAGRIALSVDDTLVVRSVEPVNDDQWHHVVLTRDTTTGAGQVYLDGRLSASGHGPSGERASVFSSLGRLEAAGGARYFQGRLDQIHVFGRVLDLAAVAELRDNHAPKIWDSTTVGTSAGPFATESILFKAYDPDQDALAVWRHGSATNGAVSYNGDGTFTYAPNPGFIGKDAFLVTVEDGRGGFASTWMQVTVTGPAPPGAENRTTTFTGFAPIQAGGVTLSLNGWRCPRVLDWDGDGDLDLLIGHSGTVWRYLNTGSPGAPVFAAGVKVKANNSDIALSGSVTIALADMTGDEVPDLVAVDNSRKIRVYRNQSPSNGAPVYAAAVFVKDQGGSDFVLPNQRFDIGDWNGDGLPDVVQGTWDSEVRLYLNVGTAAAPRYNLSQYEVLESGAYNLYPRLFDLSRNGVLDYIRGINWGSVNYWLDNALYTGLGPRSGGLTITDSSGASPDLHALTDGAMIDFGDFNGDGVYDAVLGGHANTSVYLATGVRKTVADSLADIEAIYDAYPTNLGAMLETNSQALLIRIRNAENNIINHLFSASLTERQTLFGQLAAHVQKYPFLQMAAPLNTTVYHHLPSIAGQNLLTLHQLLPDTPTHRANVANAVGLAGTWREIYLNSSLHVGDNQRATRGQIESVRDLMKFLPRAIFPDTMITLDHYYGDGRGGHVNAFTSSKNTFNWGEGSDVSEWAGDLNQAVLDYYGAPVNRGDYFTFVMGHEVTHSLDGYVNSRANKDLRRRWGQVLCYAAGPDIIAGASGWIDWTATKANFQAKGYWDGVSANWTPAWSNYWSVGPGKAWESLSFMRGNIDWFLENSQESLATQANHHHAHSEARLVGALDRYRRGIQSGIGPLKANLNEVVHFLDFQSAGLNKVVLYDTIGTNSPYNRAVYVMSRAWLERDDRGYITRITVGERVYHLTCDSSGIYTRVESSLVLARNDSVWTFQNQAREFNVLANDERLEGGPVSLASFTQPAHGNVTSNLNGTLLYTPAPGFVGSDSFTYTATAGGAGGRSATVTLEVVSSAAPGASLLIEYWNNLAGSAVSDLTGSSRFPASPDLKYYTNSAFELRSNAGDNYGSRVRALLFPPTTGLYTFWIASDDSSELYLSTNSGSSAKTRIASVSGWTSPREWTKFASQQSAPVTLIAGQSYYLETLHKEGSSLDNLAVAWEEPGFSREVIPPARLKHPFYGFSAPRFDANPLVLAGATIGQPYLASLAGSVTDTNTPESLVFTKLAGPAWLGVGPDGTISGTPAGPDVGLNSFTVRVTDSTGFVDQTTLQILVANPAPPQITALWRLPDGNLGLEGAGQPNGPVRVWAAPDLTPQSVWADLFSGAFDEGGRLAFSDLDATNHARRFYRLASP